MLTRFICLIVVLSTTITAYTQVTADFEDRNEKFRLGKELYDNKVYGSAVKQFESFLENTGPLYRETSSLEIKEAKYYKAVSNLYIHPQKGKEDLLDFANEYSTDRLATYAYLHLGQYHYNVKNYQEAITSFTKVNMKQLDDLDKSNLRFRKGYCHFVMKEFVNAEFEFRLTKDERNIYYYPTNYYYGMCAYFKDDYNEASRSFERVANSTMYGPMIPSYLAQIYFAQGKYKKAITYIEQELDKSDIRKKGTLHQILGQSYYVLEDFEKALPHLETFERETEMLTMEEFYQLAITQYRLGHFEKAISNFLELALLENEIGHSANYYIADCYLKLGDKEKARLALKKVSDQDYIIAFQEEALMNYAKISAEMGYDSDAIDAFSNIDANSNYYSQSQTIMSKLFLESKDYEKSIDILKKLANKSKDLQDTYAQVLFSHASQLYADGSMSKSIPYFQEVIDLEEYPQYSKEGHYWIAQYLYGQKEYNLSIFEIDKYFKIAQDNPDLDFRAQYLSAYAYLSQQKYAEAAAEFEAAKIRSNAADITDPTFREQYGDVLLRSGDTEFKSRNFVKAFKSYTDYIDTNMPEVEYAKFQKGILQGLLAQPYDKINTLSQLQKSNPRGPYADDALFEMGNTYLELGNSVSAEGAFQTLLRDHSNSQQYSHRTYLKLGLIYYNKGDVPRAQEYYKAVFAKNPDGETTQEALNALQEIYVENLSDFEGYVDFVETLPGFSLNDYAKDSLSFRTADVLYKNGEYTSAIEGFDNYLNQFSNGFYYLESHYKRAESYAVKEDYKNALTDYEFIITEGRNRFYEKALSKAALIAYNHEENFNKALAYFTKIEEETQNEKTREEAQIGALRSAFREGNRDATLIYSEKVQNQPSVNKEILAYSLFTQGTMFLDIQDYTEAIRKFRRVRGMTQNVYAAQSKYNLAWIAYKQGEIDKAESYAQKAYKESANYQYWVGKSLLLLSDIYVDKNDYISARAAVEAILDRYKEDDDVRQEAQQKLDVILAIQESNNRVLDQDNSDTLIMEKSGQK